jgi:hypothetical protein
VFERFTDQARRVVVLAQEEARLLNHNYIGTEHILLGLVHDDEGIAARALQSLDIELNTVRAEVEEIIGHGTEAPSGHIPFTRRAKKVLELSLREALQLGHNYIGTEHILLGLVREGQGVAAEVLVKLGADLSRVRRQVIALISEARPAPSTPHKGPRFRVAATVLGAADANALASFYERLLGWVVEETEPGWVRLRNPYGDPFSAGLSFAEEPEYIPPVWPAAAGEQQMMVHLDIAVDDLELAVAWAVECGASTADFQPQAEVRVMLDPAGHPFCLFAGPA